MGENVSGTVTFEKNVDDLIGTYRDWFGASVRRKPLKRLLRITGVIAALVLGGWLLNRWQDGVGYPLYGAAGGVLVAVPVCWAIAYFLLPWRVRRIFAQERTKDPRWTWTWSEAGLGSSSANGENHYGWDEFHAWLPGRHALLFFLTEQHVLYVARRVLAPGQADELVALARQAGVPAF